VLRPPQKEASPRRRFTSKKAPSME
jgi:hypothetical protein